MAFQRCPRTNWLGSGATYRRGAEPLGDETPQRYEMRAPLPSGSATQSSSSESSVSASTSALLRSRTGDGCPEAGSKKTISSVDTRRSLSEGGGRLSSGGPPAVDAVPYGEAHVGPQLGGSLTRSASVAFVDIVDIDDIGR